MTAYTRSRYLVHLGLPLLLLLCLAGNGVANLALALPSPFLAALAFGGEAQAAPGLHALAAALASAQVAVGVAQLALFVVLGLGGWRRGWVLRVHLAACLAQLALLLPWLVLTLALPVALAARADFRLFHGGQLLLWTAVCGLWLLVLGLRDTRLVYTRQPQATLRWADRWLAYLRGGGQPSSARFGALLSIAAHLVVLVLLPLLLSAHGCALEYAPPQGDGAPTATLNPHPPALKIQRREKHQRMVVNTASNIIITQPKLDPGELIKELERRTSHEVSKLDFPEMAEGGKPGAIGRRGPGHGGWPNGAKNAGIGFFRLKYEGGLDWDVDLAEGSDDRLLEQVHTLASIKTEHGGRVISVADLTRYPRGKAPPFVFMTGGLGSGTIALSEREVATLRKYLLDDGGMLVASCAGSRFDAPFRALMAKVLPEYPMRTVSHDDELYGQPFPFTEGALPMWHGSGNDALGIRANGRLVVYYHPGDLAYAWRTDRGGVDATVQLAAYRLGVDIIHYAFCNYYLQFDDDHSTRK